MIVLIRSSICALSSLGGGDVRLANGSPTARKNSSSPAGAARQSRCAGPPDAFLNAWGALGNYSNTLLNPQLLASATPRIARPDRSIKGLSKVSP